MFGHKATTPLLLGHRGASKYAPENSLAAFALALEHGCDGFEFDVQLTGDGQAVVCHDPRIARLQVANSTYERLAVVSRAASFSVLRAAHDGTAAAAQMTSALPRLEDVLEQFASRAYLNIELKVPGLEKAVLDILKRFPPMHGYVVASFLPEVIETLHKKNPATQLGYICKTTAALYRWRDLPVRAVIAQHPLVSVALVDEIHSAGKQVMAWTVNSEAAMRRLAQAGVDAIISDDTQRLCRTIATALRHRRT